MKNQTRRKCIKLLQQAQNNGDLRMAKRIMAMLAVTNGTLYSVIATTLKVSEESIGLWANAFLLKGVKSFSYKKPPGKPSKLTKTQIIGT
jgi:transposase